MRKQTNQLRIIGGVWRGRKLDFPSIPGLRPTPDRVRETVFNWLQFDVVGSRCLDLFAGSGALGVEALSRGASVVTFIDEQSSVIAAIKSNMNVLAANDVRCLTADALSYLRNSNSENKFDIVFCDPPFQQDFLPKIIDALSTSGLLPFSS